MNTHGGARVRASLDGLERLAPKNRLGYKETGFGDLQKKGIFVGVEFYVKCFLGKWLR
jgi:hypothetical protein